ncbi:MAG TPA: KUP/HAK/KT family potassium transporter [Dissulfurispiraceae bacterium]|nr:KUP/HAK/KT family potassium transporter [Dissulfurispiraceae bacterium]
MNPKHREKLGILVMGSLGVVFGDLGTSPLYTMRVCFVGFHSIAPSAENVLGIASLIFWALALVVSIKYCMFILRADDDGEGGIFAMMALLHGKMGARLGRNLILIMCFGSALLYGDGLITPVISVISALEGLEVATSTAKPFILPITCFVLLLLFMFQNRGSGRIGKFLGPIIFIWFVVVAALGIKGILARPEILQAINPQYAVRFFAINGWHGFFVLGGVVLCITGCEALYLDMGHFGSKAIRISWYFLALPALLCNYFGQAALILSDPGQIQDPFYGLVPRTLLYPMVALSTVATIIASQAIISGVFSMTRQAMQLGYIPRMRVIHTSEMAEGQIYIPLVNFMMLTAAIALALNFRQSENLADAYGMAVTGNMFITSTIFFIISRKIWGWSLWKALPLALLFWVSDGSFLTTCFFKFLTGGWIPVLTALCIMVIMITWRSGWDALAEQIYGKQMRIDNFMKIIATSGCLRLPGTAVFLSTFQTEVPPMLQYHFDHIGALHEKVIIMSVLTGDVPEIPEGKKLDVRNLGHGVYRITAHSGFMETPDVPAMLTLAKLKIPDIDPSDAVYYLGRMALVPAERRIMDPIRRWLFFFMQRNAVSPVIYYGIPPSRVLELGVQLEF